MNPLRNSLGIGVLLALAGCTSRSIHSDVAPASCASVMQVTPGSKFNHITYQDTCGEIQTIGVHYGDKFVCNGFAIDVRQYLRDPAEYQRANAKSMPYNTVQPQQKTLNCCGGK